MGWINPSRALRLSVMERQTHRPMNTLMDHKSYESAARQRFKIIGTVKSNHVICHKCFFDNRDYPKSQPLSGKLTSFLFSTASSWLKVTSASKLFFAIKYPLMFN